MQSFHSAQRAAARLASAVLVLASSAHAQDLGCKGAMQRMDLLPKTPHHQYVAMGSSPGARAPLSESISTGSAIYVQDHGVWRDSGFTPEEMSKRETETRKHKRASCSVVREEALEGINATLYSIQTEATFGRMNSQVWVSKETGLPLLEQYEIDTGAEMEYYEVRFVYAGIAAPPGF